MLYKSIKKANSMDNYSANKVILRRLSYLIENSKEVGFMKILNLSGITDLFEISIDNSGEYMVISGSDVDETSQETVNRINIVNN